MYVLIFILIILFYFYHILKYNFIDLLRKKRNQAWLSIRDYQCFALTMLSRYVCAKFTDTLIHLEMNNTTIKLCYKLFIMISICISIYPCYHSIHLSTNLFIYLSICLSIYLSTHLSNYLSIHLSICLSIYIISDQ